MVRKVELMSEALQEYGQANANYAHLRGYFRVILTQIRDSKDDKEIGQLINRAMEHLDTLDIKRLAELNEKK